MIQRVIGQIDTKKEVKQCRKEANIKTVDTIS